MHKHLWSHTNNTITITAYESSTSAPAFLSPHNQIPIILSQQHITQCASLSPLLPRLSLALVSPSLLSSLPALLMKCNYQMLGGRQGSRRPGRRSKIYMWIRTLNNFLPLSFSFSLLLSLHPLCTRVHLYLPIQPTLSLSRLALMFSLLHGLFGAF